MIAWKRSHVKVFFLLFFERAFSFLIAFLFHSKSYLLEQRKPLKARFPDSLKRLQAIPRVAVSGEL